VQQLEGEDIETCELKPIDLSMSVLKNVRAKWLVEMVNYFEDNLLMGFFAHGLQVLWMELKMMAWKISYFIYALTEALDHQEEHEHLSQHNLNTTINTHVSW